MAAKKPKPAFKEYLAENADVVAKTIRQDACLWDRLELLKEINGAKTLNEMITAVFKKACDEAGINK